MTMQQNQPTPEQIAVMKANELAFMRSARKIKESKVYLNRPFIKKYDAMERCFELSRQYLGKDFLFLQDGTGCRLYIRDVFGIKALSMFENANGEIKLDIEHALVFYYKLKAENSPLLPAALGVFYFIAGHQLDEELGALMKVASNNLIQPAFELNKKLFRWKKCNYVLRKYMLSLSAPEGYTAYYYEKPMLGQIGYLLTKGYSLAEADAQMKSATGGIFFSYLPVHVENMLIPTILSGGFDASIMDGYYTQSLIQDTAKIAQQYTLSDVYNVYNEMVKPEMVDVMGAILNSMEADMGTNPYLQPQEAFVYHLSPQRIGILVKDGLNIQNVLPALSQYFQPVQAFGLDHLLHGEML